MKSTSKKLVFFGSGPVAAESLSLLAENFEIEAIITKPRPRHHHGSVPVLDVAARLDIKTYTATNKNELDAIFEKAKLTSQLGVLIDFGIIVSRKVIDYFPLGIINSHFSILPQWRGADPITFAVLSGQKITGVSLMLLVEAMDEGSLLAYGEYEMPADITTPKLTDELIKLSDALLLDTIPSYRAGHIQPVPQSITGLEISYSRKLAKQDGEIDWNKPAEQLEREVRAFAIWPKSYAKLKQLEVVITRAHVSKAIGKPSEIKIEGKRLMVCCGQQALEIMELKPAGKPAMTAQAFLAGYAKQLS